MNGNSDNLSIKVELFEGDSFTGPLDLLLYLLKRNEVDIYDIPIGYITEQYLEYIGVLESLNLDIAGDYLVMAATLTQIKSKMLLPTLDESATGDEDPREALVGPLVEFSRMKDAAELLSERFILERDVFLRGSFDDFKDAVESEEEILNASVFLLMEGWQNIITRTPKPKFGIDFTIESMTIGQIIEELRQNLLEYKSAHFSEILKNSKGPLDKALGFLATLELARTGFLRLYQDNEEDRSGPRLYLANPDAATLTEFDYR
ncbi:MAG: segregation/condensation protein A [Deltaproteobacteria bacterium]|jgi:segregation and condensation protein A|nr:segregation/condensation protein A [Deltaproteobacteria bacterium]